VPLDVDQLVADCRSALGESHPQLAVRDVLERAVSSPNQMVAALGDGVAGLSPLHRSPELTVVHVVWPPSMALFPHDHRMWAAVSVYGGQEDNTLYRRQVEQITVSGRRELRAGEVMLLGDDAIHSVVNPRQHAFTAAIHVYGGDFFGVPRSAWTPDTLVEHPYDHAEAEAACRAADEPWRARERARGGAQSS
jgi:predicted metal-dependent enzyme (double-stranded beta helix superfamily)